MMLNLKSAKLKQPALIGLATSFVLNLQACQVTTDEPDHSQLSSISKEQYHFSPSGLRTELMQGQQLNHIQDTQPEFSWVLPAVTHATEQTAYQIQLVSAGDAFQNQQKVIWDSGFVKSAQSLALSYDGPSLSPGHSYQWRVRVKTQPQSINKKVKTA